MHRNLTCKADPKAVTYWLAAWLAEIPWLIEGPDVAVVSEKIEVIPPAADNAAYRIVLHGGTQSLVPGRKETDGAGGIHEHRDMIICAVRQGAAGQAEVSLDWISLIPDEVIDWIERQMLKLAAAKAARPKHGKHG